MARKEWAKFESVVAESARVMRALPERYGFNADLQKVADPELPVRVRRAAAMRQARAYLANNAGAPVYERLLADAIVKAGLDVTRPDPALAGATPIDTSEIDKALRLFEEAIARNKADLATAFRSMPPRFRKGRIPKPPHEIESDIRRAIQDVRRTGKRPAQATVAELMDIDVRALQYRIAGTGKTWAAFLRAQE